MYRLVTKNAPYEDKSDYEIQQRHLHNQPPAHTGSCLVNEKLLAKIPYKAALPLPSSVDSSYSPSSPSPPPLFSRQVFRPSTFFFFSTRNDQRARKQEPKIAGSNTHHSTTIHQSSKPSRANNGTIACSEPVRTTSRRSSNSERRRRQDRQTRQ